MSLTDGVAEPGWRVRPLRKRDGSCGKAGLRSPTMPRCGRAI